MAAICTLVDAILSCMFGGSKHIASTSRLRDVAKLAQQYETEIESLEQRCHAAELNSRDAHLTVTERKRQRELAKSLVFKIKHLTSKVNALKTAETTANRLVEDRAFLTVMKRAGLNKLQGAIDDQTDSIENVNEQVQTILGSLEVPLFDDATDAELDELEGDGASITEHDILLPDVVNTDLVSTTKIRKMVPIRA